MLCLNQISTATKTDKLWHLDTWAQLFKSKTWEDIIRQRCRAREEYECHERTVNKKNDLTIALAESKSVLAEKDKRIAQLEALLKGQQ